MVPEESIKSELIKGDIKNLNVKNEIFKDKVIIVYKNNKKINIINNFVNTLKSKYNWEVK